MKQIRAALLPVLLLALAGLVGCGGSTPELPGLRITADPGVARAIEGQKCVFLVQISHQDNAGPVTITAVAPGCTVEIDPEQITAGQVGEVRITPGVSTPGSTVTVSIQANQGTQDDSEVKTITVVPGADNRGATAAALRDRFVAWLQANRSDFGITDATVWEGTIVQPETATPAHYLYLSADWEMGLEWSTSITLNDYALMYLRHRITESKPSYGLEIDSVGQGTTPHYVIPPFRPYR